MKNYAVFTNFSCFAKELCAARIGSAEKSGKDVKNHENPL